MGRFVMTAMVDRSMRPVQECLKHWSDVVVHLKHLENAAAVNAEHDKEKESVESRCRCVVLTSCVHRSMRPLHEAVVQWAQFALHRRYGEMVKEQQDQKSAISERCRRFVMTAMVDRSMRPLHEAVVQWAQFALHRGYGEMVKEQQQQKAAISERCRRLVALSVGDRCLRLVACVFSQWVSFSALDSARGVVASQVSLAVTHA